MRIPTVVELITAMHSYGYTIPNGVHFVLLRRRNGTLDAFDDMLCLVRGGTTLLLACRCTTDPGKGPRQNPKHPAGCAVWAEGQVVDGLGWGRHHGDYECFVPVKPIPVLRYSSLDDVTGTPSTSSATQIHHASSTQESVTVGAWSEGCIVVANPADWAKLIDLTKAAKQTRFTPTLMLWG